jgi:1,4-alpha-glucan branching enzyme
MATASTRSGIGAMPYSDGAISGTTFRVWAPFASTVNVAGEFNSWSQTANPLVSENNGYWSFDIPDAGPGQKYKLLINGVWKIDPRARRVTNSIGDGVIENTEYPWRINDFQFPPWNELVIYEMHLATFPDNPVANPNLFEAAAADMGYLKELGINAILLLPTGEFPGDNSWGYNPSHIFAVESSYGGPEALKSFVDRAHENGIGVILDVVYNHFGPNDLAIWQFDGWFQEWFGPMGGIYFYNDWRARTPWGEKNRPDYGRGEVRQFIRDNALMWLEEYRLDGLRFDSTVFMRNVDGNDGDAPDNPRNLDGWGWNLLRWINDEINARQPWKITIAEDLQGNGWITASTPTGGAGFDSQWDSGFVHPVRRVLTEISDENRNMGVIRSAVENRYNNDALKRVIYTESHDEVAFKNGKRRLPEDIDPGHADSWYAKKRSTLGAALVFTSPGIPMIFQGQEMLEWIPFGDTNRMDWNKYDQFRGIHDLYRDLIRLRRNWFNNTRGLCGQNVNVFHTGLDKVVAFHRWDQGGPGDDVIIVLNFSDRQYPDYRIGFPLPGLWWARFNSDWNGYSADFGNFGGYNTMAGLDSIQGMPASGTVGIGPYSALILSQ